MTQRPITDKKANSVKQRDTTIDKRGFRIPGIRIQIQSRSDKDPNAGRRVMWGDHWVKEELGLEFKQLGASLVEKNPDIFIHLFGAPAKKLPQSVYKAVWLYSHPDRVTANNLEAFNKIYCASSIFIPKLRAMGYSDVELMIASSAKRPVTVPIKYQIIFVGNARHTKPEGRSVVKDITRTHYDFKVWGNLWENILPPDYYGGRYWPYDQLDRLYASALITVNDHHKDMAREGFVSNKIFDILASGGFVISQWNAGIEGIFGDSVPQYRTNKELLDLLAVYIKNPEERSKLMQTAQQIAQKHTYRARAIQILQDFIESRI